MKEELQGIKKQKRFGDLPFQNVQPSILSVIYKDKTLPTSFQSFNPKRKVIRFPMKQNEKELL